MSGRDRLTPGHADADADVGEVVGSAQRAAREGQATRPGARPIDQVATAAVANKGTGAPVDPGIAQKTEAHLGVDLSAARVHTDDDANRAADAMGARAFAHDRDVYLGTGESSSDLGLMSHELTHVAQQGAAKRKVVQRDVTVGAENSPAETEADAVSEAVTGAEAPTSLLIEDGATAVDGQMTVRAFVDRLRPAVTGAANDALSPLWSADDCPYIDRWLNHYAGRDAAHCEAVIRRYAPNARNAQRAEDYIGMITARVRRNVASWALTGVLPEEAAALAPGDAAAASERAGSTDERPEPGAARPKPRSAPLAEPLSPADLGPGEPLAAGTASRMGGALGEDVGGVRVHTDDRADAFASRVGAKAVTAGSDIAFAAGEYKPGSPAGDALLAHELAHTAQQKSADRGASVGRQPGGESMAAERDADRATRGVMARLYGGAKSAANRIGTAFTTSFQLQRCSDDAPAAPADPFVAQLEAKLDASDTAGFFADLRTENGARAGNAALRTGLERFNTESKLSTGNTFRAILLQEIGADDPSASEWPVVVRNFADGVDAGQFTVSLGSVPQGAEALREFCMVAAHHSAEGTGVESDYRGRFNSKWESSPFAAMSTDFDSTLSSKGPKNPRARAIFNDLYRDATLKTAYDDDSPTGFRETADTHAGPTGTNLIASPRLDALRGLFNPPALSPAPTASGDASYTTFLGVLRPVAANLTNPDISAIEADQQRWRAAYVTKLGSSAPTALVSHLQGEVQNGTPAAPPARNPSSTVPTPTVGPAPGTGAPAAPGAPPPLTAGSPEHNFVHAVTVSGPRRVEVESKNETVELVVASTTANPSLTQLQRHVEVTPSAQVDDGTYDDTASWPVGATDANHYPVLNPQTTNPTGETQFNASVEMQPYGHTVSTTRAIVVKDKRLDMLRRDGDAGLAFGGGDRWVSPTSPRLEYYGGQVTVRINPNLGGVPNPGLTLFVRGEVKSGGSLVPGGSLGEVPFRDGAASTRLTQMNVVQPSAAATTPDNYTVDVEFLDGPGGTVLHTVPTKRFRVHPGINNAAAGAQDTALLNRDRATLHAGPAATPPSGAPPTMLDFLKYPPASVPAAKRANYQRVSAAIAAGVVPVEPMIVRSDSAQMLVANGLNPESQVVYAMGSIANSDAMAEQPGWAGWQFYANSTIYINVTPDPANPGTTRSIAEQADFAAHEAVHSTDTKPPTAPFDKYRAEFRAYWVDGGHDFRHGAPLGTDFDPSFTFGPKSPKANAIFLHIYEEYPHTRDAYDTDSDFRERVDNYLYPDGINLIVSVALHSLRAAVQNTVGTFATRHARIKAIYDADCTAADKAEITSSRAWRDLVEAKFSSANAPVPGATPARSEPRDDQIKDLLHIPR